MKHSHGPWKIENYEHIVIRIPKDGSSIAYVLGEKNAELKANAALIAAAPDLLHALYTVMGDSGLFTGDISEKTIHTVLDAIEKAENIEILNPPGSGRS